MELSATDRLSINTVDKVNIMNPLYSLTSRPFSETILKNLGHLSIASEDNSEETPRIN